NAALGILLSADSELLEDQTNPLFKHPAFCLYELRHLVNSVRHILNHNRATAICEHFNLASTRHKGPQLFLHAHEDIHILPAQFSPGCTLKIMICCTFLFSELGISLGFKT